MTFNEMICLSFLCVCVCVCVCTIVLQLYITSDISLTGE